MNPLEEFLDRTSVLKSVHYEDATGRLLDLLQWLEQEPATARVLQDLRTRESGNQLFTKGQGHRPRSHTREQIARVGLHLIEICRIQSQSLVDVCVDYDIQPPEGAKSYQDYIDSGLQDYITPFLRYVEKHLLKAAEAFSVTALAEERFVQILSTDIQRLLPVTSSQLQRIATEFLRPEKDVLWQNIGNSCRQTLLDLTRELRAACDPDLPADTKASDAKTILKHILAKLSSPGRHRDSLESLVNSVWDHTQSVLHRPATTRVDATRDFLWTGLLVSEFAQLLRIYNEA